jgi:hypothetical protein
MDLPIEVLLQKGQILEQGQGLETLARRKSNAFSYGSRSGFTGDGLPLDAASAAPASGRSEKSTRSKNERKGSVLLAVTEEFNRSEAAIPRMASNKVFAA